VAVKNKIMQNPLAVIIRKKEELSMKKLHKLLLCFLSIASTISIIAENKQQIRLSNQSKDKSIANRNILVHLTWRMSKAPHTMRTTDVILRSDRKDLIIKAPISGYKLFSIDVTPAINLASLGVGGVAFLRGNALISSVSAIYGGIAYGVTHSLNHHTIRAHGHKFFVIATENKNSQIQSQKQVNIQGYTTLEEYHKVIGKVETIELDEISASFQEEDNQLIDKSKESVVA